MTDRNRDVTTDFPRRFMRAVRADCGVGCTYPECGHKNIEAGVRRAIIAWDKLPDDTDEAATERDRLRALLKHADDVVIWEHTPARYGFQEEIEAALGIGDEQVVQEEKVK